MLCDQMRGQLSAIIKHLSIVRKTEQIFANKFFDYMHILNWDEMTAVTK